MKSNVQASGIVTVADLVAVLAKVARPVVLLEGIRALPEYLSGQPHIPPRSNFARCYRVDGTCAV